MGSEYVIILDIYNIYLIPFLFTSSLFTKTAPIMQKGTFPFTPGLNGLATSQYN